MLGERIFGRNPEASNEREYQKQQATMNVVCGVMIEMCLSIY